MLDRIRKAREAMEKSKTEAVASGDAHEFDPYPCACVPDGQKCAGKTDACMHHECLACGEMDCPHGEPLHYHHDGCPACTFGDKSS